ncbi:hypothetical protein ACIGC1_09525 [Peribacillus butanolivorans]
MQVAGFIAPLTLGFVIDAFGGSFKGAVWFFGFIRGCLLYRFYDIKFG